jgi:hypothetical protein
MIPHGTIEKLEHLIRLIDSRKDYQDRRIVAGTAYRPNFEIDDQIYLPPPKIGPDGVTENAFYEWIEQLCVSYEAELTLSWGMLAEFRATYGPLQDNIWLTPDVSVLMASLDQQEQQEKLRASVRVPTLSELTAYPDDEMDAGAQLKVVRDDSSGFLDIPGADQEPEETNYSVPRFSWPEV